MTTHLPEFAVPSFYRFLRLSRFLFWPVPWFSYTLWYYCIFLEIVCLFNAFFQFVLLPRFSNILIYVHAILEKNCTNRLGLKICQCRAGWPPSSWNNRRPHLPVFHGVPDFSVLPRYSIISHIFEILQNFQIFLPSPIFSDVFWYFQILFQRLVFPYISYLSTVSYFPIFYQCPIFFHMCSSSQFHIFCNTHFSYFSDVVRYSLSFQYFPIFFTCSKVSKCHVCCCYFLSFLSFPKCSELSFFHICLMFSKFWICSSSPISPCFMFIFWFSHMIRYFCHLSQDSVLFSTIPNVFWYCPMLSQFPRSL